MKWQYRTILFEFQKDGILGDRYIDDEEMQEVFNEHGEKGWELVSVTPVQEGLLSILKRVVPPAKPVVSRRPVAASGAAAAGDSKTPPRPRAEKSQATGEKGGAKGSVPANKPALTSRKSPVVGDIKIS